MFDDRKAVLRLVFDTNVSAFVVTDYVKLEVVPNATFFERTEIVAFYEELFETVEHWALSSPVLSARALALACQYGLGAVDVLHDDAAERAGTEYELLGRYSSVLDLQAQSFCSSSGL